MLPSETHCQGGVVYTQIMGGIAKKHEYPLPPLFQDGRPTYIYVLSDPTGASSRIYIGVTCNLKRRLEKHLTPRELKTPTPKTCWLKSLLSRGVKPLMTIIAEIPPGEDYQQAEIDYIAHFRALRGRRNVTNTTDGGHGYRSTEPRKPCDPAVRARLAEAATGRPKPPEMRAKIAAKLSGRKRDPDAVARGAAKLRGRKRAPETIEKISAANTGRRHTPEARAKMAASQARRFLAPVPEEDRRKMSEAQKARWAKIKAAKASNSLASGESS